MYVEVHLHMNSLYGVQLSTEKVLYFLLCSLVPSYQLYQYVWIISPTNRRSNFFSASWIQSITLQAIYYSPF